MRDYTDACFRYLRATGLFAISQRSKSLTILKEKLDEVKYYLETIDRNPVHINDSIKYKQYLFDTSYPVLYNDNRDRLESAVYNIAKLSMADIRKMSTTNLKNILKQLTKNRKKALIDEQVSRLKSLQDYIDIVDVYQEIKNSTYYDNPLMFEWNTWRAMTMLNGGIINANFNFDDYGQPMSTASGNMADILCDYGSFLLTVEVTLQSGQRQFETEGESVTRHLAKIKKLYSKEAYCFFIAPKINDSCIAHFYTLHRTNVTYYGGTSAVLPMELSLFEQMVEQSTKSPFKPESQHIRRLCEYSIYIAQNSSSEVEWYEKIKQKMVNWLA
jgi:hypothetical protein